MKEMDRRTFLQLGALSTMGMILPGKVLAMGNGNPKVFISIECLGGMDPLLLGIPTDGDLHNRFSQLRGTSSIFSIDNSPIIGAGIQQLALHPELMPLAPYIPNMRVTMNCANATHVSLTRSHELAQIRMATGTLPAAGNMVGWKARIYDNSNAKLIGFTGTKEQNFNCESARCQHTPPLVTTDYESHNLAGVSFHTQQGGQNNTNYVANVIERLALLDPQRNVSQIETNYRSSLRAMFPAIADVQNTLTYTTPKWDEYLVPDDDPIRNTYNPFAMRFRNIAATMKRMKEEGDSSAVIFVIPLGSFDSHTYWTSDASTLMRTMGGVLRTFLDDCASMGMLNNVVISTETDFGRKTFTNNPNWGGGTDHGSGFSILTLGGKVNGGANAVYGDMITLEQLNNTDAWPVQYDNRAIIAEILERHLSLNPLTTAFPGSIGSEFQRPNLNLFNT